MTTIVKDRATGELEVKNQISYKKLASFLAKLNTQIVRNSTSVLSEDKKSVFPKTQGKITYIITTKPKLQSFASKIMAFWRKCPLGGAKMGGGEFPEWDTVAMDIATMPLTNKQLEKAVDALGGGFSLNIGQLIDWEDNYTDRRLQT